MGLAETSEINQSNHLPTTLSAASPQLSDPPPGMVPPPGHGLAGRLDLKNLKAFPKPDGATLTGTHVGFAQKKCANKELEAAQEVPSILSELVSCTSVRAVQRSQRAKGDERPSTHRQLLAKSMDVRKK